MIALDTNVVVRFLVKDDAAQTARAAAVIRNALAAKEQIYICEIVLCEVVWVLTARYRLAREAVAATLRRFVAADGIVIDNPLGVTRALDVLAAGRVDFADALVSQRAREKGCTRLFTFDRALLQELGTEAP